MRSKKFIAFICVVMVMFCLCFNTVSAELDLPIIVWVEGQAYCDGKLMTNCVVYDSNADEHYVMLDANGHEFKRSKSYAKLTGLNEEYGTLNVFADVPENFTEKEIDVVLEDAADEHIVRLFDYNGYSNYISLLAGDVSVIDCYVAGDAEFKYEIESAVSIKLDTDMDLVVTVKDISVKQDNKPEPELTNGSESELTNGSEIAQTTVPTTPTAEKPSPTPIATTDPEVTASPTSDDKIGKINFADLTSSGTGNVSETGEKSGRSDMSMDEYLRSLEEKRKLENSSGIGNVVFATTEPTTEPTLEPIGTVEPTIEPSPEPTEVTEKDVSSENNSDSNVVIIVLIIIAVIVFVLWWFLGKRDSDSRK